MFQRKPSKLTIYLIGGLLIALIGSGLLFKSILPSAKSTEEVLGLVNSPSPQVSSTPRPSPLASVKASSKPTVKPPVKSSIVSTPKPTTTTSLSTTPSASSSPIPNTQTPRPSPLASASPTPAPTLTTSQVNVEIQATGGNSNFTIEISGNMNVCDVLQKAKDQGRISSLTLDDSYKSSLNSMYLKEMNGLSNNWTFKVNDNSPLGCSLYQVKPNDQIVWKFG